LGKSRKGLTVRIESAAFLLERDRELIELDKAGSRESRGPLGEFRVIVLGAQDNLEGASAPHEPCEVLGDAAAGDLIERRLERREDLGLACGEPHVARED
jgi:hypothetical protein